VKETILFYNAGTSGDANRMLEPKLTAEVVATHFIENVAHFIPLVRSFLGFSKNKKSLVVNISTLLAILERVKILYVKYISVRFLTVGHSHYHSKVHKIFMKFINYNALSFSQFSIFWLWNYFKTSLVLK
jgi:hypothetical protein